MNKLVVTSLVIFLSGCAQTDVTSRSDNLSTGFVSDFDGNQYETVKIGEQVWMAENLRTTHYRDGSPVQSVSVYDSDESNALEYGRLYRWETVSNMSGICPTGWRVPSDSEWQQLEMTLGMEHPEANDTGWRKTSTESRKIKQFDTVYSLNGVDIDDVNRSGFSAVPSGARTRRNLILPFWGGGRYADFWTSTESSNDDAWIRSLVWSPWHPGSDKIFRDKLSKDYGYSIRCIKN